MNDLEAVRRVIALYAHLLDDGRFAEWGQLFAEDAEWISLPGLYKPGATKPGAWIVRGRDEIVRQVSETTRGLRTAESRGMHFGGHPVIDIQGDRANAWWDFIIAHITPGALEVTATGRYYARFERQGGRWRFVRRVSVQQGAELPPGLIPVPGA
ncbi:MAG: nuclear transport factor 2 family protein [Betaproteobacteria bacterium]|nr:nuclear transport factor 2 family protein [Betaproteobacteria bacterium]